MGIPGGGPGNQSRKFIKTQQSSKLNQHGQKNSVQPNGCKNILLVEIPSPGKQFTMACIYTMVSLADVCGFY